MNLFIDFWSFVFKFPLDILPSSFKLFAVILIMLFILGHLFLFNLLSIFHILPSVSSIVGRENEYEFNLSSTTRPPRPEAVFPPRSMLGGNVSLSHSLLLTALHARA